MMRYIKEKEALADKQLKERMIEEMVEEYKRRLEEIRGSIEETRRDIMRLEGEYKEVTQRVKEESS